jgi:hypothetical protein
MRDLSASSISERKRETQREKGRERKRQTDRQTDRQTEKRERERKYVYAGLSRSERIVGFCYFYQQCVSVLD